MAATVQGAGVELAYEERGEGPSVLLVHGIADGSAGWADGVAALAPAARTIAYDRRGYGASGAPQPYQATTVAEQSEDAAALLRGLDGAPAVVCGRDIGALVCLDLVKRHRPLVRAAVVVDPPLYAFSPMATEALATERIGLEEALRAGGPERAVEWWLAERGADPERVRRARSDHQGFFADFSALATWPVLRRDLRGWEVPLSVLVSPGAPGYLREGAEALASLVPGATLGDDSELVATLRERLAG